MVRRDLLLTLLGALGCVNAALAFDCERLQLTADEPVEDYLSEYTEHCVPAVVTQQLTHFGLPTDVQALNAGQLLMAYPAWEQIRATMADLKRKSTTPGAQPPAQMADIYTQLETRADAAITELTILLDTESVPDVSALGYVAWGLVDLELPELSGRGDPMPIVPISAALHADCPDPDAPLCPQTIVQGRSVMDMLGLAQRLSADFSKRSVSMIRTQIEANDALWTTYLYDSKPMLPLDFVITDWLSGGWQVPDPFADGFRHPPRTQWFLLHPSIGVEYASAAADGDQLQPTLVLEVLGANRWDPEQRWINLPLLRYLSGVSLTANYADRAGIKDTGYGLLLTFSNVYSIGAARYSGTTGIYLSVDLANLFRDKYRPRYHKFKDKLSRLKDTATP
jgi:hypothetical protein